MIARIPAILSALVVSACALEPVESVTLTPESQEISDALQEADARWEAAGVAPDRIIIGPGGAPVRVVDSLGERGRVVIRAGLGETRTYGRGPVYGGVRWMTLETLAPELVLHEMGHALGIFAIGFVSHIDESQCEADADNRPLMCATFGRAITEADLELACDAGECVGFQPEI